MVAPLLLLLACGPGSVGVPADKGPVETGAPGSESAPPEHSGDTALETADTSPPEDSAPLEEIGDAGIVFDPEHGLVIEAFELEIHFGLAGGELRYTLDASDPRDPDNDGVLVYDGPIPVTTNTVLRVAGFHDGAVVTELQTRTWIFPEQTVSQGRPEGWPATFFSSYGTGPWNAADYEMDPEIVEPDPAAVEEALWAIPTVSLVIAMEDLFGATGIYDNPTSTGEDWERPASLELLPTDHEEGFAIESGARIHGGASRSPENTPKKSFRILFKESYGAGELSYPLFEDYEIEDFDTLMLRAGYNHTWTHWSPEQRSRALWIRDAFAADSQRALGDHSVQNRAAHLYINGVYWGLYRITERPDARAMAAWYGGATEDWDVINTGEAVDGDITAWNEALALASARDTDALAGQVDIDNLIDCMLLNFYLGNDDWPHNNWYAARQRPDGLWRFFEWDAEHTLKELSTDMTGASTASSPAQLWTALLGTADFKAAVSARADELLATDGPLGVDAAIARFEARAEEVGPAVLAESARWGDHRRDVYCYAYTPCELYTVEDYWEPEHTRLLEEYLPQRTAVVDAQISARGW